MFRAVNQVCQMNSALTLTASVLSVGALSLYSKLLKWFVTNLYLELYAGNRQGL